MKKSPNCVNKAILEVLEDRRLMSGTSLANGVLTVQGDLNSPNNEAVSAVGSTEVMTYVNGTTQTFEADKVSQIVMQGGNAADRITIDPALSAPVTAYGHQGNDTINSGSAADMIRGGRGDDMLNAGKGQDSIFTGCGNDTISGANSSDSIVEGVGTKTINGQTVLGEANTPFTIPGTTPSNNNNNTDPTGVSAVITVTSGQNILAGQTTQVQGLNSTLGSGNVLNATYDWNFGDTGSEYNTLTGFNAAHLYKQAGTYTITLTVTNNLGQVSQATTTVNVSPDARPVIYVSNSGNDANNGASANDAVATVARAEQLVTSDSIVLFQAGGTYDMTQTFSLGDLHDVTVSSYGQGAKPTLLWTGARNGSALIASLSGASNIVISGLTLDSIYDHDLLQNGIPFGIVPGGTNISVVGNTFLNLDYAINANVSPEGLLVQDNTAPSTTGLRGYFVWVQGNDVVILGNTVANSTQEHNIRGYATRVLIAYNNLTNIQTNPAGAAKTCIALQGGSYAYVVDNTINAGGYVDFGPVSTDQPAALANTSEEIDWVVLEGNTIHSYVDVQPGTHHLMIRDNVIENDNTSLINVSGYDAQYDRVVSDLQIVNNTGIDAGDSGEFLTLYGPAQGITVDSNLFVAPGLDYGSYAASAMNILQSDLSSFSEIHNNIWPAGASSWRTDGGIFYLDTNPQAALTTAYLTVAQAQADGVDSGDTLSNVTLNGGYSVNSNGQLVGSNLAA